MLKLVSVIIPCFNAERWLREAIDSCLQQTYPRMEIIVFDDGSTDNSLEIIKSYGDRIIWDNGPNRGGNHARNKGFALSKGEYIQYLDADDYLLPEKIERQVGCLEETGADMVYGDWRYQHHSPDGTSFLGDIEVGGPQEDLLESLLADGPWVPTAGLLLTRAAVNRCGGWDESLKAIQDRDFKISIAMNGATVYQPGCHSIYRRYGKTTVSTSCEVRCLEHKSLVLEKAERKLGESGRLSIKYRQAIAKSYFAMARQYLDREYLYMDKSNYLQYLQLLEKILRVYPDFKVNYSPVYNFAQRICGFKRVEILASYKNLLLRKLRSAIDLKASKNNSPISRLARQK